MVFRPYGFECGLLFGTFFHKYKDMHSVHTVWFSLVIGLEFFSCAFLALRSWSPSKQIRQWIGKEFKCSLLWFISKFFCTHITLEVFRRFVCFVWPNLFESRFDLITLAPELFPFQFWWKLKLAFIWNWDPLDVFAITWPYDWMVGKHESSSKSIISIASRSSFTSAMLIVPPISERANWLITMALSRSDAPTAVSVVPFARGWIESRNHHILWSNFKTKIKQFLNVEDVNWGFEFSLTSD